MKKHITLLKITALLLIGLFAFLHSNAQILPIKENSQPIRAFHMVMVNISPEEARAWIEQIHRNRFNVLIIDWRNDVAFSTYPGTTLPGAWKKQDLKELVDYARSLGLDVLPEVKLLSHQQMLFQNNFPELMYNKTTYDPTHPDVQKKITAYMAEIIELINPKAILIGHDEIAGYNRGSQKKWLAPTDKVLPAELFLFSVKFLDNWLADKGIQTWMWSDMLLSPDEFPTMRAAGLHGTFPGYGKPLRQKLPKSVVICDWHYADKQKDYPSINTFRNEGFQVLGATWRNKDTIKNFSSYAAANGAKGMIATSWFHVRRKETRVVNDIITESANAFNEHFKSPTRL